MLATAALLSGCATAGEIIGATLVELPSAMEQVAREEQARRANQPRPQYNTYAPGVR